MGLKLAQILREGSLPIGTPTQDGAYYVIISSNEASEEGEAESARRTGSFEEGATPRRNCHVVGRGTSARRLAKFGNFGWGRSPRGRDLARQQGRRRYGARDHRGTPKASQMAGQGPTNVARCRCVAIGFKAYSLHRTPVAYSWRLHANWWCTLCMLHSHSGAIRTRQLIKTRTCMAESIDLRLQPYAVMPQTVAAHIHCMFAYAHIRN